MPRLPRIGTIGVRMILAVSLPPALAAGAEPDGPPSAERAADADVYPHKSVRRQEYGTGPRSYWIFEPAEPTPELAPVVVFHHGWLAVNPAAYGAWIDHLARRGSIVIFPRYQHDWNTKPTDFLPNALAAIHDALHVLETSPKHIRPDRARFALIGHSAGGNLSAQIAAVAEEHGLPRPRAVIALLPGEVVPSREPSLARIHETTLLVVAAAEDDRVVGDVRARRIFSETTAIPAARKKFVLYRTDLHGHPRLLADHTSPTGAYRGFDTGDGLLRGFQMSRAEINAFDIAGYWRLADVTLAAAFSGRTLDEATDRGELFRNLGYWSDGRAVNKPIVGDDLATIPRVFPTNGLRLIQWTPDVAVNPDLKIVK